MAVFELVIALLFVGAMLAAWARRVNIPYPALLALSGAEGPSFPIAISFSSWRSAWCSARSWFRGLR